jgi:hypothetical protein
MMNEEHRPMADDVSAHDYATLAERYETSFL